MTRAFRTLTALAAWSGLGIQLWVLLTGGAFETATLAVWRFFAFFTILTNLIVALVSTVSALAPASALGRFADSAAVRAGVLLYIGTVGIIYHLILAALWDPQGWQLVADVLLHTVTPVLTAIGWVVFDNKKGLGLNAIPAMLIYPVGYTAYALARGAADGFYPYPFIDVGTIGYGRVILNVAGLTAAFTLGAALVIGLSRIFPGFKPAKGGT